LSKQLKQLEDEYGTKLINRTTTNMTLTPEGEMLYERAKLICDIDSQMRNEFLANKKRGNRLLKLALPIGISFYTFQIASYTIDLYWGNIKLQKSFVKFMTYVSMFPQLIAGPIVRYSDIEKEIDDRAKADNDVLSSAKEYVYT
jgi:D-alanyl-lipoteichoic acid acyltransferase DltB (MBOAT superfamily)